MKKTYVLVIAVLISLGSFLYINLATPNDYQVHSPAIENMEVDAPSELYLPEALIVKSLVKTGKRFLTGSR